MGTGFPKRSCSARNPERENFRDRACRSKYCFWVLFYFLGAFVTLIIDFVLGIQVTNGLFGLVTFIPTVSVAIRRLHDSDRTGWWYLLIFVPLIGWIILLIWYVTKGTTDPSVRTGSADDPGDPAGTARRLKAAPRPSDPHRASHLDKTLL